MPQGLRKLTFSVDGDGLTRFGGLVLFQAFCKSLGLRRFLQRHVLWTSSGRKYHQVDIFLTHIIAIVAGIGRIENTRSLTHNGLLPSLLGIPEFPHRDTLRTFLLNADCGFLRSLSNAHDHLRQWALQGAVPIWSAMLDLDTTALRIFGRRMEGGVVGYVPHYSHQRCYNVRILTEAATGQSGLFGDALMGVRPDKPVSNTLPARSLPQMVYVYDTQRAFRPSGAACQCAQQEKVDTAQKLSACGYIHACVPAGA